MASHTNSETRYGITEQFSAITNVVATDNVIFGKGTGSEVSGAVTINHGAGKITTSALTTAAGSSYSIVLTNSEIGSTNYVQLTKGAYGGTTGAPSLEFTSATSGSATIKVNNFAESGALNGTLVIYFSVI